MMATIDLKQCRVCKFTKLAKHFTPNQRNKDGLTGACRTCLNAQERERRALSKTWHAARLAVCLLLWLAAKAPVADASGSPCLETHAWLVDTPLYPGVLFCQDAACEAISFHALHWRDGVLTFNSSGYGPIDRVSGPADIFLPGGPYLFKLDYAAEEVIFDVPYTPTFPFTLGVTMETGAFGWLTFHDQATLSSRFAYEPTGDYDLDGTVDGRDLLVWQRNPQLGSVVDWQSEYGSNAPTAAESSIIGVSPVPEPGSVVLVMIAVALWGRH